MSGASGACACRRGKAGQAEDDAAAVFVKVITAMVGRDYSPEAGQVIRLDRETARELEADGRAVRVDVGVRRAG